MIFSFLITFGIHEHLQILLLNFLSLFLILETIK